MTNPRTNPEPARSRARRAAIVAIAILAGYASLPAAVGNAQPGDIPCSMAVSIICHFLPIAPDWEGDIDLTVDQPSVEPSVIEPDQRKPADYCINGCT